MVPRANTLSVTSSVWEVLAEISIIIYSESLAGLCGQSVSPDSCVYFITT